MLVQLLILLITLSLFGQSWGVFWWMLAMKPAVCPRTANGDLKCGSGKGERCCTRKVYTIQGLKPPEEGKKNGLGKGGNDCLQLSCLQPSVWQNMLSGWQTLKRRKRIRHSISISWWCFPYHNKYEPHKPWHDWWKLCMNFCQWSCTHCRV